MADTNKSRLEKMLQDKEQMEKASTRSGFISLKGEGDHLVRILPRLKLENPETDSFYIKRWLHYVKIPNEATRMVLCRGRGLSQPCPVCETIEQISEKGTSEEKNMIQEWKLKNKETFICRAIDGTDGQAKLLIPPPSVGLEIISLACEYEQKGVPIDHHEKGYWINIYRTGKGRNDTKYSVKAVKITDPTDATKESLKVEKIPHEALSQLLELPDLAEQLAYRSYEDTDHYFKTGEKLEKNSVEEKKEEPKETSKTEVKKEEKKEEKKEVKQDEKWQDVLGKLKAKK